MRIRRRKAARRLDDLARLLVELDRASTEGRFRRRETGSRRLSLSASTR